MSKKTNRFAHVWLATILFSLCSAGSSAPLPHRQLVENSAISLLLLPPVAGQSMPRLAVNLDPSRGGLDAITPGIIELWAINANGHARRLPQRLSTQARTQLIAVDLQPDVDTIEARWLDHNRKTVATQGILVSTDPLSAPANNSDASSTPKTAQASGPKAQQTLVEDWYALTDDINTSPDNAVEAAVLWDDGNGPLLVIGGLFDTAGGKTVNHIAGRPFLVIPRVGHELFGSVTGGSR